MPNATTLRGATSALNTSQTVNVVPEQVIKDQRPRNLDDALVNISGITQTNTLAGTQDAVMRRGFGDNRDGSIMRNGMPLVQGRALTAAVESVEVLKGPASLLYGIIDPGGIVNTISKRPELYQHGEVTLEGATYGSRSAAMQRSISPARLARTASPIASSAMASTRITGAILAPARRRSTHRRLPGMVRTPRCSSITSTAIFTRHSTAARRSIPAQ